MEKENLLEVFVIDYKIGGNAKQSDPGELQESPGHLLWMNLFKPISAFSVVYSSFILIEQSIWLV